MPISPTLLDLINGYAAQKPYPATLSNTPSAESSQKDLEQSAQQLSLEARKKLPAFYYASDPAFLKSQRSTQKEYTMPVLPTEENTGGNITDQVAKESKDSTASTHEHHQAHKGAPGPVSSMSENVGEQGKASKEELKKRAEELNK